MQNCKTSFRLGSIWISEMYFMYPSFLFCLGLDLFLPFVDVGVTVAPDHTQWHARTSGGLLWAKDRPVSETFTNIHKRQTQVTAGIRPPNVSTPAATDLRLKQRRHCNWRGKSVIPNYLCPHSTRRHKPEDHKVKSHNHKNHKTQIYIISPMAQHHPVGHSPLINKLHYHTQAHHSR